jgi:hypothetical protein
MLMSTNGRTKVARYSPLPAGSSIVNDPLKSQPIWAAAEIGSDRVGPTFEVGFIAVPMMRSAVGAAGCLLRNTRRRRSRGWRGRGSLGFGRPTPVPVEACANR